MITNLLVHLRRAEMLSIQLNQLCWEDLKTWIVYQVEHIQSLKCNRNYLFTWKNKKDCYLAVRDL